MKFLKNAFYSTYFIVFSFVIIKFCNKLNYPLGPAADFVVVYGLAE